MTQVNLSDIITIQKGKKPNEIKPECFDGFFPYVDIKAFETGKIDKFTNGENCVKCEDDDLLIVCDGSRSGLIGKAVKGFVGSTLARIDCDLSVDKDYLYYFIQSKYKLLNSNVKGTGTPHLKQELLKSFCLYLPSIEQQKQIVKRIEESLSQLNSAVETLKKTKQQLEIYRQAVLKEAFDTAISDCRMMSIGDLLTTERKGMTTGPFGTLIKKSDYLTSGVPMLGIENIGRGQFIAGNRIFVSDEKAKELSSFQVSEGDLIISRSGTVGEICPIPKQAKGSLLSTNLIRITLNNRIILNDYFIALFQSKGIVLDQIKELCKGSTRIFLNQSILKRISFPVPTLFKQKRIVDVLSARTEAIKPIETTINQSLQQAEALRQSILKQAFSMMD